MTVIGKKMIYKYLVSDETNMSNFHRLQLYVLSAN